MDTLDLSVSGVTTINAERTFWDKIVIAHGLRSWYYRRGELRQDGQRISRHYYDLHSFRGTEGDGLYGMVALKTKQDVFNGESVVQLSLARVTS